MVVTVYYLGFWVSPWTHSSGGWWQGLREGHAGAQLEGLAAGQCCGASQWEETGEKLLKSAGDPQQLCCLLISSSAKTDGFVYRAHHWEHYHSQWDWPILVAPAFLPCSWQSQCISTFRSSGWSETKVNPSWGIPKSWDSWLLIQLFLFQQRKLLLGSSVFTLSGASLGNWMVQAKWGCFSFPFLCGYCFFPTVLLKLLKWTPELSRER